MELYGIRLDGWTVPPLDRDFIPLYRFAEDFRKQARAAGKEAPVRIAIRQGCGPICIARTVLYDDPGFLEANCYLLERTVKFLLWSRGGYAAEIYTDSKAAVLAAEKVREAYAPGGERAFDAATMTDIYEHPFSVEIRPLADAPGKEAGSPAAVSLKRDGCRIGLDAGASSLKVTALRDGETVYRARLPWDPANSTDPGYHLLKITEALRSAAEKLPRVDSVGISSAGVFIENRAMISSLLLGLSKEDFEKAGKDVFIRACRALGDKVPVSVVNDGDISALTGAMQLERNGILGISMGSSQAGGYLDENGRITGWLNELAFVPVAGGAGAARDPWSGDVGTGSQYFSAAALLRLAPLAGITLSDSLSPAEKAGCLLKLAEEGNPGAVSVFETVGCYLGHTVPLYKHFYEGLSAVFLVGGVLQGIGGETVAASCRRVLEKDYPACPVKICLAGETDRAFGQSMAAAMACK